jgi:hypothetical protein
VLVHCWSVTHSEKAGMEDVPFYPPQRYEVVLDEPTGKIVR